jgi:hypothetical protein
MHGEGFESTRSFDVGLTSAEDQKLEWFNEQQIIFLQEMWKFSKPNMF